MRLKLNLSFLIILSVTYSDIVLSDEPTVREANEIAGQLAEVKRIKFMNLSFEEFKRDTYKEPFEGGKYIVNGDTPVFNEKSLREFFDKKVKNKGIDMGTDVPELIVHQVGGLDAIWSQFEQRNLTYCVSPKFDLNYDLVVQEMEKATKAWEDVADVNFIHLTSEDNNCTPSNDRVVFDVRPVNVNGQYLARAFFPNENRKYTNVLIDKSAFNLNPNGKLSLVGILRHELGHTLGFRHEHTRPDSGKCFEDENWRELTDYDPFSVMHYPQCNGLGDWTLTLTKTDKNGAACIYGTAPGFIIDSDECGDLDIDYAESVSHKSQTVKKGKYNEYGPYYAKVSTQFTAIMKGTGDNSGDPDLYLKFDSYPVLTHFDCRPYLDGADESCTVDVPKNKQAALLRVYGYKNGEYELYVTYRKP